MSLTTSTTSRYLNLDLTRVRKFDCEYDFLETFRFHYEYEFDYEYDFLETFRFHYEYEFDYEYDF